MAVAGLYIHVPFCLKKCFYCAFVSEKKPDDTSGMCRAILSELEERTGKTRADFRTIYAGGGTPTLLPPEFWMRLMGMCRGPSLIEATIETNPAILDASGYSSMLKAGFNRISIGVQSFSGRNLSLLGRIHSAEQARNAIRMARESGFQNISMDLMYGLPGQTIEDQKTDIEETLRIMPEHISAYDLTLEPGTPMGNRGIKASDDVCTDMYKQLHEMLTGNGYIHYEVSSYALGDSNRSVHNSAYWNRTPYMGIGPSAHSFDGSSRSWNTSDLGKYESDLRQGRLPEDAREILTNENCVHEILALGFRNINGVDLIQINRFGYSLNPEELLETGMISVVNETLVPDVTGMLFADHLALNAAELLRKNNPGLTKQ